MSYLALYRKYRPTTFDSLIGQEHIVKTLINQIITGRFGHAYLFTGTRGTGKTSAAKIFAKAINCLEPINGSPCGKCDACKALADSSNIDVIEIDAASNNGVNEIRELREKVQYPPVSCKYKVYIVDEVHMLTGPAFNALLKTLEEPPKHAVFILATTEVHKIPATILSRCMRFDFRLISTERIADLISDIYDEQGKQYEKEAVFAIAKAGDGSIRDALSIADIAISYNEGKLTYNDVMDILGSSNFEILAEFVGGLINGNSGIVLNTIDKLCSLGKSMGVLTKDVTGIIRDLLIVKTCENANDILGVPLSKFKVYNDLADKASEQRLLRILEIFSDAEVSLKYSNHPRVVFETAAIKSSRPDSDYNIDALMSRIKALEENVQKGNFSAVKDPSMEEKADSEQNIRVPKERKKVMSITDLPVDELKGKLLYNLRNNGSEMLWNMFQKIDICVKGNTLKIICQDSADSQTLEKPNSKQRIFDALNEFSNFDIVVEESLQTKKLDAIDDASDRIKKIFGDDIVVIK